MSFCVLGTGSYAPPKVVTNDDLASFLETSDEWIRERTGIRQRHVCEKESACDLAYQAALAALEQSGVKAEELDMILCATISSDFSTPSMACVVQKRLGASCPAMDISAACSGFLFLLDTAAGFFARGRVKKMLVIGAERISRLLDWDDRSTCVIFGDGAGAMVLGEGENYLISQLSSKGDDEVIRTPVFEGKSPFNKREQENPYIHMKGQETFRFAVTAMTHDLKNLIAQAGFSEGDIDWVVPHQANIRIIDAAKKRLNIPPERFCVNIDRYGNTSAASIPMMMDELNRSGKLKRGDLMALCAFGGGLFSAACILRW